MRIRKILSSVNWAILYSGWLLILLFGKCAKNDEIYLFRMGHVANEDHTWHRAFLYFSEQIKERSGGRIIVEVYPNEQLGKEVEIIRSISLGIADMTITGGTLQNWTQKAAFSDMPFVLRDTLHLQSLVKSSLAKQIEQAILDDTDMRVVAYFQRGPRYLTSNRPIRSPDDLNGIIIRVPNVPSYVTAWSGMGAKPTPMAFSEVFTSLQQGTIEAQENPLAMIHSANFNEVQQYVNLTGHVISWGYVVVGEDKFQSLPGDLKSIFLDVAGDMQDYEHHLFLEKETELRMELETSGMQFIEVDKEAFNEKGSAAVYAGLTPEMKSIYDQIRSMK